MKEKKIKKTFIFTTVSSHALLRDDRPILMRDLHLTCVSYKESEQKHRMKRVQQNVKSMMGRLIIRTPNVVGNFVAVD
jgi:hypothetical protein